jgi:hypothetical protein
MEDIDKEIERLQKLKIIKLEEIKKKKENSLDLDYNINIIKKILETKQYKLDNNTYSKSCFVSMFQDRELVPCLEAIINSLNIIKDKFKD